MKRCVTVTLPPSLVGFRLQRRRRAQMTVESSRAAAHLGPFLRFTWEAVYSNSSKCGAASLGLSAQLLTVQPWLAAPSRACLVDTERLHVSPVAALSVYR